MSYIAKAEHALLTNQPRLAELYMRRDLSDSEEGRRWLERHDASIAFAQGMRTLGVAFNLFIDALGGLITPMRQFAEAMAYQPSGHTGQDGYALVSDNEG